MPLFQGTVPSMSLGGSASRCWQVTYMDSTNSVTLTNVRERGNIMNRKVRIFAFCLFVAIAATGQRAQATNLTVNCDKKETIREALKLLLAANPQGPNTLVVSGNCRENILIQSMERLTLITKRGATITDRSNGTSAVVDIEDSHSVTLKGFTINGGSEGVTCGTSSICYL